MTLLNCTVTGNTASASNGARGGGILGAAGTWTLTDCTLSGNSVTAGNYAYGGGMWNGGVTSLTNCTVTGNTALQGGGLQVGNAGTMTLGNTIVAGNTASSAAAGPDVRQVKGIFVSAGHNLIGMTDGSTGWLASDLTGTSAQPVVFWTGTAGNGDWDTASNWIGNAVPGQNPQVLPQVVIPNGVTVQHAANTTENIDSLSLGTGATLNVGNGNFTLNGGSGVGTSSVVVHLELEWHRLGGRQRRIAERFRRDQGQRHKLRPASLPRDRLSSAGAIPRPRPDRSTLPLPAPMAAPILASFS